MDTDNHPRRTEPRLVHAPTPDVDWEALDYLPCYLISEAQPSEKAKFAVKANRRPLGTASTLAEARDLITNHIADSLIFVEEHYSEDRVWAVAVTDQPTRW